MTQDNKPYERCLAHGARSLTDTQLLGAILRVGTSGCDATELAEVILKLGQTDDTADNLLGLTKLSIEELTSIKGVGKVKAVQIQCICELSRRMAKQTAFKKLKFTDSATVASYYMEDLRHLTQENLMVVMLDNKCNLIKDMILTIGTANSSLVSPRDIFLQALKYGAVFIVLLHNHPSGDATPSGSDISVTKNVYNAGELLGIHLLDHIIIGDNDYVSLKEQEYI
jgi:DNA repair protein RadC